MLEAILKMATPDQIVAAIKSNPSLVQVALFNFDSYKSFAAALSAEQQLCISNNLNSLDGFLKAEGRELVAILADAFVDYVASKAPDVIKHSIKK